MSIQQEDASTTTRTIEILRNKYRKLKTLVLKLKPNDRRDDLSSMNSEQLDSIVDEMIADLQNSLLFQTNDLRERIKQIRPDPNDPLYEKKVIIYKELLTLIVPIMQKLQNVIAQTLDELHSLIRQLWDDISKNNGQQVERLLEEHQRRTEEHMNGEFIKNINELEKKLEKLRSMTKDNTEF
ncbi:unnamed protein product [Rotaria sp. Silwood2]|nr:unnamed protein product [Rotaria sp. Silwood2]CAF2982176.1 unnamed protein product [Rotaria sp. Silwood2]CAF3393239.1 unnamed protein product [Rotaria sp. Silwood2]CAF3417520.1 unnamed protein product [Rotaria sp. Silwood2]CAF4477286.1 unnamed protein product [Rotaria sp. Silwood2]